MPVEYEIDKTLGIKGPQDVAKMGIDKYNSECHKIVMSYASEWETIVGSLGRWIISKMTTNLFTHGLWSQSGGCSRNSLLKGWCTAVLK